MKIIIVEDDPVTLAAYSTQLRQMGHEVTEAENAELAWLHLQSANFHVVISDWDLPGDSGLALCARIRARVGGEYIYFITITFFKGREKLNEAMDAGVDDFLTKPIDMDTLAVRLRVAQRILDFHSRLDTLKQLLPICMYCKNIRNDNAYWETVESYFKTQTGADFTHSLCPDCYTTQILPQLQNIKSEQESDTANQLQKGN